MSDKPKGDLVISTVAMPANTNVHGDIFGGWLVSQMDVGAAVMAQRASQKRVVTVAINDLRFILPVKIGDVVCCYGTVTKVGTTSLTMNIDVWAQRFADNRLVEQVAQATFVFVAIDDDGKPTPLAP